MVSSFPLAFTHYWLFIISLSVIVDGRVRRTHNSALRELLPSILAQIYRTARALELRNEAVMSLRDLDREEGERDRDFRLRPTYKRKGTIDVPLESPISKRELRFAWGLVVINLCRLLLSLPFLVVSLVDRTIKGSPVVHQVAFFLMMLNSCMNWVILLVFDLALKRSLKKAMCGQDMDGDQRRLVTNPLT